MIVVVVPLVVVEWVYDHVLPAFSQHQKGCFPWKKNIPPSYHLNEINERTRATRVTKDTVGEERTTRGQG